MDQEQDIQLAEDYIKGDLNESEKERFEQRLKEEQELREILEDIKFFQNGISRAFKKDIRESLAAKERMMPVFKAEKKTSTFAVWGYVTAAAVIAAIAVVYALFFTGPQASELYLAYYESYPNLIEPNVRGETYPENSTGAAMDFYDRSDFEKALNIIGQIPENEKTGFLYLYEGICYLETGKPEKALLSFKDAQQKTSSLNWQVLWYSGLTYLKMDDIPNAQEVFETLSESDNPYQSNANEILNQL